MDEPLVEYYGSSRAAANRSYLHADHQGSIIAHTDSTGAVVAKLAYDSFGIPAATNIGRFGYTGQTWFKEVGLNYYKARFYSPKLGRFLQTDPIGYEDDMDLYSYVGNDPVNMVDPTGEMGYDPQAMAEMHSALSDKGSMGSGSMGSDSIDPTKRRARRRKELDIYGRSPDVKARFKPSPLILC